MNALRLYRDDGLLAPFLRAPERPSRFGWLAPPLARVVEYGSLIAFTFLSAPARLPFCFAFLAVLAFHHYDCAYRLRLQGSPPAAWVGLVGGGWEIRVALAGILALAGALGPALLVAAIVLGSIWVGESALSWLRFARAGGAPGLAAEELE